MGISTYYMWTNFARDGSLSNRRRESFRDLLTFYHSVTTHVWGFAK